MTILAVIQIFGVFLSSFFGFINIVRAIKDLSVPPANFLYFAIGVAMATCGLFIK